MIKIDKRGHKFEVYDPDSADTIDCFLCQKMYAIKELDTLHDEQPQLFNKSDKLEILEVVS